MTTHDQYFDLDEKYRTKFGESSIILMQVGSFYEIYGLEEDRMLQISDILRMTCTQKNKSKGEPISKSSPYMIGFPDYMIDKYVPILLAAKQIIIRVDQTSPPPKPLREVTAIYSIATYIEEPETKNLMAVNCSNLGKRQLYSVAVINLSLGTSTLFETLDTDEYKRFYETYNPAEILNNVCFNYSISQQNSILGKAYKECGLLTPIEYCGLSMYPELSKVFAKLIEFAYEHDTNIINHLSVPNFYDEGKYLKLYTNSLHQLDVIGADKSLLNILDKTSTPMGHRLFRFRLLNPITNIKELEKRYDSIDNIDNKFQNIECQLRNIGDIERLIRRITLGKIQLFEYSRLINTCSSILEIDYPMRFRDELEKWVIEQKSIYNLEELAKYSNGGIRGNIFNKTIRPEIDAIVDKIAIIETDLGNHDFGEPAILKRTESGEYYYEMTAVRYEKIRKKISKEYETKKKSSSKSAGIKITSEDIRAKSDQLLGLYEKLGRRCQKEFVPIEPPNEISNWVAELDVIVASCRLSKTLGHVRPILSNDNSYIQAKDLRHPIIEQILEEYTPNDVDIGKMLLFGINGCGKSSYMKSIGLAIIMAQAGLYVAAKEFKLGIYHKIYTRISGDDNIYRGQSSFAVEMSELREIIKGCDSHSLVLGDEVCRGTESKSAVAIVLSSLRVFQKRETSFIFATHLHELLYHDLGDIHICHLSVDTSNGIHYGRRIQDGSGNSLYGIEVARYLIDDPDFIKSALDIRNVKLMGKKSKYNSNVFVDKCAKCDVTDGLHVHHIEHQSTADEWGIINGFHKNMKSNLIVLCERHHKEQHMKDDKH